MDRERRKSSGTSPGRPHSGRFALAGLHLATAIAEQANVCLTGDGRLNRCTEMNVAVLQP